MRVAYREVPYSNNNWNRDINLFWGGFGRGLGQNINIYHIQLSVALYEFLGVRKGFGSRYIFISPFQTLLEFGSLR